ncbi:MAG: hypothetical protein IT238_01645 [Bacteroidia bacterium]|nr:hypothetical protein [Bacteroidia bacterium]MCZ2247679.1 hypothetical protein [Bacteroidia bacterium]
MTILQKQSIRTVKWTILTVLFGLINLSQKVFAQAEDQAAVDTTVNKTTQKVFQEIGRNLGSKDSLTSIIMIIIVLIVVAIAVYLSFRSPSGETKRKKVLERQRKRGHQG